MGFSMVSMVQLTLPLALHILMVPWPGSMVAMVLSRCCSQIRAATWFRPNYQALSSDVVHDMTFFSHTILVYLSVLAKFSSLGLSLPYDGKYFFPVDCPLPIYLS